MHDHMRVHHVKQWLLQGAMQEDAKTIHAAVKVMPGHRLIRRLARALTKDLGS
jgi:hypothetical protein